MDTLRTLITRCGTALALGVTLPVLLLLSLVADFLVVGLSDRWLHAAPTTAFWCWHALLGGALLYAAWRARARNGNEATAPQPTARPLSSSRPVRAKLLIIQRVPVTVSAPIRAAAHAQASTNGVKI